MLESIMKLTLYTLIILWGELSANVPCKNVNYFWDIIYVGKYHSRRMYHSKWDSSMIHKPDVVESYQSFQCCQGTSKVFATVQKVTSSGCHSDDYLFKSPMLLHMLV